MSRALLLLALCGCAGAQRHPAIAAAITGGVVGGLACEIDSPSRQATCAYITLGTAAFLGGIAALVTLIADTNEQQQQPDEEEEAIHTGTPPPPGELEDAGVEVDAAPAPVPVPVDAAPADQ